ncbi:MAG: Secretion system C-terminal sorting domain, partial [Bacteroidota bacterium]
IQTNKAGLMFDDLRFEDYYEGISEIKNNNMISISPNPVSEKLSIHTTKINPKQTIQIFNYLGKVFYEDSSFIGDSINTLQFPNGIYFLKYSDTSNFCIRKFVVQHQ